MNDDQILLNILFDIRMALGVGEKPMLSELADEVKKLKVRHDCAMKTLRQIAARDRKTVEQRLASTCVSFLDNV